MLKCDKRYKLFYVLNIGVIILKKIIVEVISKVSPRTIDLELLDDKTKLVEDLGLDSIALVTLVLAIEDRFQIHFPETEDFASTFLTISTLEKRVMELRKQHGATTN